MPLKTLTRLSTLSLVAGFATIFASGAAYALTQSEPKADEPAEQQLILGDENSDAMPTGSIDKVDSGSCEKGSSNLKIPGAKKTYVPEETP